MYSLQTAYLLWLPSVFGIAGLHRFYLGKPISGFFFLITGGLFGIGTVYDALTMRSQVRQARIRDKFDRALANDDDFLRLDQTPRAGSRPASIEQVILKTAKKNNGVATPAEVALEGNITTDQAKSELDKLMSKGFAEIRVRKTGHVVYVFPDFLDDNAPSQFEDF